MAMVKYNHQNGRSAQYNGIKYLDPMELTPAQTAERIAWAHKDGTDISWRTAATALTQYPTLVGLCGLLPPLGVSAALGAACLTSALILLAPSVLYEIGFRAGLARWDKAHGYERV